MNPSHHNYDTIGGSNDEGCYAGMLDCCGGCVSCVKTWMPCIGCLLCCFSNPFQFVSQGNKGIITHFKRYDRMVGPGLCYVNPMTEELIQVDSRINVIDLDRQMVLTKDNININVDACVYFTITEPCYAVYRLENVRTAVSQMTYSILKNTAGIFTFQELLEKRNDIANDIEKQIEPIIRNWGIRVNEVYFKDFQISAELENELNSAPRARRTGQSNILSAQADVQVAKMLADRSKLLDSATAMQIRYLETLRLLSAKEHCKVIYTPGHH